MPRFVILRHELPEGDPRGSHWDLMFEFAGALRTWAVESEPASPGEIDARRLDDHRLAYLEYEGPVSGGRGTVTRWDAGEYSLTGDAVDECVMTLRGARLVGQMTLRRMTLRHGGPAHCWRVSFSAAPING